MLSNFVDWMVDGLYDFAWLVETAAKWCFDSLKTSLRVIARRIKKK